MEQEVRDCKIMGRMVKAQGGLHTKGRASLHVQSQQLESKGNCAVSLQGFMEGR